MVKIFDELMQVSGQLTTWNCQR